MKSDILNEFYKNVPREQVKRLQRFRANHSWKSLAVSDSTWKFISCGRGREAIVFLHGGAGNGESWFRYIMAFEDEYRIVSPTYPAVTTMNELIEGIGAILKSEGIRKAHIVGASLGGFVAQCFVRKMPDAAGTLILISTAPPNPQRVQRQETRIRAFSELPYSIICSEAIRGISNLIPASQKSREFVIAFMNESFTREMTKEQWIAYEKCMVDFHGKHNFSRGDLLKWRGRILIIEAGMDEVLSPSEKRQLEALYPAEVRVFPNATHDFVVLDPERLIIAIRTFLRGK